LSGDVPRRLVVDAGPLIALFHEPDHAHTVAVAGFHQLFEARTEVLIPLPIVFEVYKWIVYQTHPAVARQALERMREALDIVHPSPDDLDEVVIVLDSMPTWGGSLEDALVAVTGLSLDVPVWTLNYRDLSAFRNLQFWTPTAA
jgi:predicted nucleic acid-binding protein